MQIVQNLVKESYRRIKQSNDLEDDQLEEETSPLRVSVVSYDELDEQKDINASKNTTRSVRPHIKSHLEAVSSSESSAAPPKGWEMQDQLPAIDLRRTVCQREGRC